MNRLRRTGTRLSVAGTAGLLLACNSSTVIPTTTVLTTSVVVMPEDFLGELPCSTDAGAMQAYRTTLLDVTDGLSEDSPEVQSAVISCKRGAYFEGVTVGNRYMARIVGYPRSDLSVDPDSGATLDPDGNGTPPTWTTTCYGNEIPDDALGLGGESAGGAGGNGGDPLGVVAYNQARVYVRACLPLTRTSDAGVTGAVIRIESALGGLKCGQGPNEIDRFTVLLEDGSTGGSSGSGGNGGAGGAGPEEDPSASCGESVTIDGLLGGQNYTFEVVAFESDADDPSWGTICRMTARSGVLVQAKCETLRPLN